MSERAGTTSASSSSALASDVWPAGSHRLQLADERFPMRMRRARAQELRELRAGNAQPEGVALPLREQGQRRQDDAGELDLPQQRARATGNPWRRSYPAPGKRAAASPPRTASRAAGRCARRAANRPAADHPPAGNRGTRANSTDEPFCGLRCRPLKKALHHVTRLQPQGGQFRQQRADRAAAAAGGGGRQRRRTRGTCAEAAVGRGGERRQAHRHRIWSTRLVDDHVHGLAIRFRAVIGDEAMAQHQLRARWMSSRATLKRPSSTAKALPASARYCDARGPAPHCT